MRSKEEMFPCSSTLPAAADERIYINIDYLLVWLSHWSVFILREREMRDERPRRHTLAARLFTFTNELLI